MKKILLSTLCLFALSGCSFLAPYEVTFTTPAKAAVVPETDTLDLAISHPALAYLSGVSCEGYDPIEILPVFNESMKSSRTHNLKLNILEEIEANTKCMITVTVYDKTTTATSSSSIAVYAHEKPEEIEEVEEVEEVEKLVEETIEEEELTEVEETTEEIPKEDDVIEEATEELSEESVEEETTESDPEVTLTEESPSEPASSSDSSASQATAQIELTLMDYTQESCVDDGGQWNKQCTADNICTEWCEHVE